MAKAPVCSMEIDEKKAFEKSDYKVKAYYFAQTCKSAFDKDPTKHERKTGEQR